jgi:uncharacterized heparinase superfamily protein
MSTKRNLKIITAGLTVTIAATSCASVKEYQKNKLNDSEMVTGSRKVQKTEMSFQTYREGASGANGGKTGGGCGCN